MASLAYLSKLRHSVKPITPAFSVNPVVNKSHQYSLENVGHCQLKELTTVQPLVDITTPKYNDVQACHLHGRLISQNLNWHHGIALYDFCPVKIWKRSSLSVLKLN